MARRRSEIVVERLKSKEKGQINGLNVKHVLVDLSRAVEGTAVVVKFGSRRYPATMWLTRVEIPIEAQKEQGHPLYSLSGKQLIHGSCLYDMQLGLDEKYRNKGDVGMVHCVSEATGSCMEKPTGPVTRRCIPWHSN